MKPFTCSFRDSEAKTQTFEIYTSDPEDAERRLSRLKANATVDGEIILTIPAPSWTQRIFHLFTICAR